MTPGSDHVRAHDQRQVWPARFRRVRFGRVVDVIVDVRATSVVVLLLVVAAAVSAWAMTMGSDDTVGLTEIWQALSGQASDGITRIVVEWRMPRVVLAAVAGLALGASGAIFQSLTRNPLGSPDIIGFNTGAYTGALVAMLVLNGTYLVTASGAVLGGMLTALLVYGLSWAGGVQGTRLVVVGIAMSAMLTSLNGYLIVNAKLEEAMTAAAWGAGSVTGARWIEVYPAMVVVLLLLPLALMLSARMRILELGDEAAVALGVGAERVRLLMVLVGVGLTAAVTAVAGPIAFVALSAPQIARRITGTAGTPILPSAAMGCALLVVSDVLARTVLPDKQLPVGVVTVCLGGGYLVWLLIIQSRKA